MPTNKTKNRSIISTSLKTCCLLLVFIFSCDNSLTPIIEGNSIYTIYGILDLDREINFIRINDIKTRSDSEEELELEVKASLKNIDSSNTEFLKDSVIVFDDNIITHNFYTEDSIKFGTNYQFTLSDSSGKKIDLFNKTPDETATNVMGEMRLCCQSFFIEIEGIDREDGESIEFEVGFENNGVNVWGTTRNHTETYIEETNTLRLQFSPNQIISDIAGPGNGFSCSNLSSNKIKFRYTHFSSFENGEGLTDNFGNIIPGSRIIISKYERDLELEVDTDKIRNEAFCGA